MASSTFKPGTPVVYKYGPNEDWMGVRFVVVSHNTRFETYRCRITRTTRAFDMEAGYPVGCEVNLASYKVEKADGLFDI